MKVLVIGGGVAGVHAALGARSGGAEVTMVEASESVGLSRSLLPAVLAGAIRAEEAVIREAMDLRVMGVEVRTSERILSVDHASRTAESGDKRLHYDSLVLATGSSELVEGMGGLSKGGVFVLRRAADYVSLRRAAVDLTSVAVAGSGLLTLAVAESISRRGLPVSVFHPGGQFSPPMWDEVVEAASRSGVRIHRKRLEYVAGVRQAEAVVTGGEVYPCDGVVIIPRSVANLPPVGCEVGKGGGVAVDELMQTSLEGIFAAGDCAEVRVGSSSLPLMLHSSSRVMGDVAGRNAAGGHSLARPSGTTASRVFGVEVCSAGLSADEARIIGLDVAETSASFPSRDSCFGDEVLRVSLTYEGTSHVIQGVHLAGMGSLSLAAVASMVVGMRFRLEDLEALESPYLPGENSDFSPIGLTAARALGMT